MKRILALLLACLLLCAPALAETVTLSAEAAALCGVWELTALIVDGATLNPAFYGMTMTLTFNPDGSFISDDGKQPVNAAWQVADGVVKAGNATLTPLDDGRLSLASGSNTMLFTQRERFDVAVAPTPSPTPVPTSEPSATPAPTLSPEDSRAPFCGEWLLTSLISNGVTLNPALYGVAMTLTFHADGTFISDDGKQVTTTTWQVTDEGITAGKATLTPGEDGSLTLISGGNTMVFTRPQSAATPTPAPTATPAPTPTLPEDMLPYVGVWHLCYVHHDDVFDGLYGDLRVLSVFGTLTLQENRNARLKVLADGVTYLDESSVWLSGGDAMYFSATLAPMTLLDSPDGPFLRYGTETDYLIFHRSEDAVWTPQADTTAAAPILFDVHYTAVSYSTLGMTIPVSEEEDLLTFVIKSNGTCAISMYGIAFTCSYAQQADGSYTGSFMGESFTFTPTATGLDLHMPGMDTTFSLVANPAQP